MVDASLLIPSLPVTSAPPVSVSSAQDEAGKSFFHHFSEAFFGELPPKNPSVLLAVPHVFFMLLTVSLLSSLASTSVSSAQDAGKLSFHHFKDSPLIAPSPHVLRLGVVAFFPFGEFGEVSTSDFLEINRFACFLFFV